MSKRSNHVQTAINQKLALRDKIIAGKFGSTQFNLYRGSYKDQENMINTGLLGNGADDVLPTTGAYHPDPYRSEAMVAGSDDILPTVGSYQPSPYLYTNREDMVAGSDDILPTTGSYQPDPYLYSNTEDMGDVRDHPYNTYDTNSQPTFRVEEDSELKEKFVSLMNGRNIILLIVIIALLSLLVSKLSK